MALGLLAAVPAAVMAAQPTCGQTLTTNTTLTADLDCSGYGSTALYMGANSIVLNLNGHTIWGPPGNEGQYGVDTDGYNRTTIKNGSINHYYIGVYVNNSNRTLVQNLEMTGENANDYGVYVDYGVKNTLNLLDIHGFETAVYGEYGANLTVKNSTLSGDTVDGEGLYLYEQTADTITGNHFHGYYGVYDYESHRQAYSGNTSNGNEYGFYLYCDSYGTVNASGNTANNNGTYGIYTYYCYVVDHPVDGYTGSRIVGNTASGNETGFYDESSYNAAFRSNVANDNSDDGLYFDSPAGSKITFNSARRNGDSGIEIASNYSWYNVAAFNYNTAKKNAYGLYASYGVPDATGNVATMNTSQTCYNIDC